MAAAGLPAHSAKIPPPLVAACFCFIPCHLELDFRTCSLRFWDRQFLAWGSRWNGLFSPPNAAGSYLGIFFNVLILFVFKYNHFFLPSLIRLFGVQANEVTLQILLPVGLSFLVVQMISYLVDVANKRLPAEHDLIRFGLYTLYFPKLISGPVERARLFFRGCKPPCLSTAHYWIAASPSSFIGFLRKLVFANPLFSLIPPRRVYEPA